MQGVDPQAIIFRRTEDIFAVIDERDSQLRGILSLRADSADAAEHIAQMLRGGVAMGILLDPDYPHLAKAARKVKIKREDSAVRLGWSFSATGIPALIGDGKAYAEAMAGIYRGQGKHKSPAKRIVTTKPNSKKTTEK